MGVGFSIKSSQNDGACKIGTRQNENYIASFDNIFET
jgi:hypothetical protein